MGAGIHLTMPRPFLLPFSHAACQGSLLQTEVASGLQTDGPLRGPEDISGGSAGLFQTGSDVHIAGSQDNQEAKLSPGL